MGGWRSTDRRDPRYLTRRAWGGLTGISGRVVAQRPGRPIVLTGAMRSGSTITAQTLGRHPDVAYVGFELGAEWGELAGCKIASPETTHEACPAQGAPARVAPGVDRWAAAAGVGRRRPLLKSPHLWNKLERVADALPDADLVVTLRGPDRVVPSLVRLFDVTHDRFARAHHLPDDDASCFDYGLAGDGIRRGWDQDRMFPGGDPGTLVEYWLRCYRHVADHAPAFGRVAVVEQEPWLADPHGETAALVDSLELRPVPFPLPDTGRGSHASRHAQHLSSSQRERLDASLAAHRDEIVEIAARIRSLTT